MRSLFSSLRLQEECGGVILEVFSGSAAPFIPSEYLVKFATETWERREAVLLRRAVFCQEQGIFGESDRDEIDGIALPIVALSFLGVASDEVVGTVRIHEARPGVWWGSRLAVAAPYRRVGDIGAGLIRFAVSSARARGCSQFLANVQSQNAPLFRKMHWQTLEEVEIMGRSHHHMQADLSKYPPVSEAGAEFLSLPRKAAA